MIEEKMEEVYGARGKGGEGTPSIFWTSWVRLRMRNDQGIRTLKARFGQFTSSTWLAESPNSPTSPQPSEPLL